ncbi:tRNA(Ile)-lysidine synthase [Hoeflea halophila]|uniref:tRNA(Ile)-lysidine synthase n=1 Tax=Hoeflea halophila TaxID=714899 RepID=A0A286I9F4_9HYPH|nr:tRNA lysidine(34) synthetase TilS [Hoeflea halophila]SOE16286.1 tRNA(Ile)-lysidine synthase [Hoeflea halophila]
MELDVSGVLTQEPQPLLECLTDFHSNLCDRRPLGIAVSGGSDSLGLLYGLAAILPPHKLVALTVDHGLRPASADEARWVKAQCKRLGIRHETLTWQSGQPATGLQAAARAARYRLLARASTRLGLAAMVTAHTHNDQLETLAMRRARSFSDAAPGLAGIPAATLFEERMWVLRPLLEVSRETIREFLRSQRVVGWIEDPSNADTRFERVRVRRELENNTPEQEGQDSAEIAMRRFRLASEAAALLDSACSVKGDAPVRMRFDTTASAGVVTAALEALIDWQGGASRPLDRRGKAALRDFLSSIPGSKSGSVVSLGRTLVRHRGSFLTVERERRDVAELMMAPGACGVWDRRFEICNRSKTSSLHVSGGEETGVLPCFTRDKRENSTRVHRNDGVIGGFTCRPLLGRSSRILPVDQLPIAQALARLAGRGSFPECPWTKLHRIPALTAMKVQSQTPV